MSNDWLPRARAKQLELAKRWSPLVNLQKTYWKIQQADITRLDNAILLVGDSQESFDNNASPGNRAELREAYRGLVAVMRFFKTRYFLKRYLIPRRSSKAAVFVRPAWAVTWR